MDFSNMLVFGTEANTSVLSHGNATVQEGQADGAPAGDIFGGGGTTLLLMYTVIIAVMWTMIWRPQKKKAKKTKEMHQNIKVGDEVVTSGGLYGKIVDIGTDAYVLEFGSNKGVRIPVNKNDVVDVRKPNLDKPKDEVS